jgi:hypothetical protein
MNETGVLLERLTRFSKLRPHYSRLCGVIVDEIVTRPLYISRYRVC